MKVTLFDYLKPAVNQSQHSTLKTILLQIRYQRGMFREMILFQISLFYFCAEINLDPFQTQTPKQIHY